MAQQFLPGFTGLYAGRIASMDKRSIGKFTDTNHLESFHRDAPSNYDKKIISLYTQTSLYKNDFLQMLDKSTPYYLDGMTDTWRWEIEKPFMFPVIVDIPQSTLDQTNIGIDGKEFEVAFDVKISKNAIVSLGSRIHGQQFLLTSDPVPYNSGWLNRATLVSDNPTVDSVDRTRFLPGVEVEVINASIGEFDQDLLGLDRLAERLEMFESLGSGYSKEHTITGWADDKRIANGQKDTWGNPMDIIYYAQVRNGQIQSRSDVKWEPFIEFLMRKEMMELKVNRMFFAKPGFGRTNGGKQELKKISAGIVHRMRKSGNYVPYNRGEFSTGLLRTVFGDLFYRRVSMGQRQVKLYTNEAGFDAFQQAVKVDALASGLNFNAGDNDKFIKGSGQNLRLDYAFDSFVTRETGVVSLIHLTELDLPQTNLEFGQNKKSTPIFIVFDVSPTSDGQLMNNIREVRRQGRPNMTWGYIDGRRSHLGAMASQGHSAANKMDAYTIFMDDRCDVFIEDMSRTVLIEELPFW
jgi:hypothetical protein